MIPAPRPEDDDDRLASLEGMNLLSTPREGDLDRVTRTAKQLFGAEIALVTLIDKDRQWFKSRQGLDVSETPRDISFCGHAIIGTETFVVRDAASDARFHDNPLVTGGPKIRFYAGRPLTNRDGYRIGTLCVISSEPRDVEQAELQALEDLARMAEIILENETLSETQASLLKSLVAAQRDKLLDPLTGLWNRRGLDVLFEKEIIRTARDVTSLAVLMVDIDHFKQINDRFGHATGDRAISLLASALVRNTRSSDIVARFGGEEFVILAPGLDDQTLPVLGRKLVAACRTETRVDTGDELHEFTVSIGAVLASPTHTPTEPGRLLEAADQALYVAKAAGRNRFEVSGAV